MGDSGAIRLDLKTLGVLEVLLEEPTRRTYGLELMTRVGIKSGSLYPILARLEREGWVESEWEEGDPETLGRPRRRYYVLTAAGCVFSAEALRGRERRKNSKKRSEPLSPAPNLHLG